MHNSEDTVGKIFLELFPEVRSGGMENLLYYLPFMHS